ncbi:MAG: HD domain-containing protein [Pseudomonadota bacterium]
MKTLESIAAARLLAAVDFAAVSHAYTASTHAPGIPYINHPIAVAHVLAQEGDVADLTLLCAAMLHDTVEKGGATEEDLRQQFGAPVAAIVMEVTDDPALSESEQQRRQVEDAAQLSHPAKLLKLADKLCNLRDIVAARDRRKPASHDTVAHFDWCARVVDGLRGVNPGLEAAFDVVYAQRPATIQHTCRGYCG